MTINVKKLKKLQVLLKKIAKTCDTKKMKINPWPKQIFQWLIIKILWKFFDNWASKKPE